MEINILGTIYKVKKMKEAKRKEYFSKYVKEQEYNISWGFTDKKRKIIVLADESEEGFRYSLEETLWHEFGHALEHEVVTSIREEEYTAVVGEYFFRYQKQLNKIAKKLGQKKHK